MASVTLLGTATFNTTSGTKTVTATPALDDLIVIVTAHTGNTSSTPPTDNQSGGQYDLINSAGKASSADTLRFWVRRSKIQVAASTVFTHAPGTSTGGGLAVFKITGMSRAGLAAILQSAVQANQAAAGTPTPVLGSAALTGNALIGAVFNATNPATMTARSSPAWTERQDAGYATPTTGLETMSIDSGETGTSIAWGGTSASAFASGVVEIDTSTAPPVEDGDWWSGTQRCFVGVAIAAAALVSGLSASIGHNLQQQTEDIVPAPEKGGGGAMPFYGQRERTATLFVRWSQQDELPASAPSFAQDADGDRLSAPEQQKPFILGPIWDDQTIPSVALTLPGSDDECSWVLSSWPTTIRVTPLLWYDDVPPIAQQVVAEDEGWAPSVPAWGVFKLLPAWEDDALPTAPTVVVEDEGSPLSAQIWKDELKFFPTWQDSEFAAAANDTTGSGSGAMPFESQRERVTTKFQRWYSQDDLPGFAAPSLLVDENEFKPLRPVDDLSIAVVWATTEEIVPQVRIDESYWWTAQRAVIDTQVRQADADADVRPTPAAVLDDEGVSPVVPALPPPVLHVWHQQDEIERLSVDDEPWPRLERAVAWISAWVAFDADDIAPQQTFSPVEDYWLQEPPNPPGASLTLWIDQDEIQTTAEALTVDEAYWWRSALWPPAPSAWVAQGTEDVVPTLAFEDYWIAPSVRLAAAQPPQVWWTDDFARVTLPLQEDDPQPMRPSGDSTNVVVWVASDEIVPQPAFSPREDYWLRLYSLPVHPIVRLWHQQDEATTQPAALAGDEGYWQPLEAHSAALALWTPPVDEALVPEASALDEAYWHRTSVLAAQPSLWVASEDEAFAPAITEEAYWQWPDAAAVRPNLWVASDTDDTVPQPEIREEDHWLQLYSVPVEPVARVWHQQDEVVTPPPPLGVAEEYWWPAPVALVPGPPPLVLRDDDVWVPPAVPPEPTDIEERVAELEAQVAALQAQMAELSGKVLYAGGGGDETIINRYLNIDTDRKKARIQRNNELIMALVGAMIRANEQPKGST